MGYTCVEKSHNSQLLALEFLALKLCTHGQSHFSLPSLSVLSTKPPSLRHFVWWNLIIHGSVCDFFPSLTVLP